MFTTLIDVPALAARLADPSTIVVDCRFDLHDTGWGERAYLEQHLPGAVYAHLDRDLSGPKSGRNGRHPLPDPSTLAATLGRMGIGNGMQVVAYDQDSGLFASRFWWELRWLGHDAVAVLDGGFAEWTAAGQPTTSGGESRPPATFTPRLRAEMLASAADVERIRRSPDWRLVDARAPERYRGEIETIDPKAGHIPGAVNHFFKQNLDERSRFRSPETLRAELRQVVGDVDPGCIVSYCGSGVTACHNVLALEHAGLSGARVYPGSWSEWIADPERPVAKSARE